MGSLSQITSVGTIQSKKLLQEENKKVKGRRNRWDDGSRGWRNAFEDRVRRSCAKGYRSKKS